MSRPDFDDILPSDLPLNLGRYELVSILGKGGMAQVFGAELNGPAGFRKRVAVKIIKSDVLAKGDRDHVDYFIREARLGGLLKHPNIVDVYELGEVEGQLFIAMEQVEGQTLRAFIRSGRTPSPSVILEIAAGIAAGLASAHDLKSEGLPTGLVHRDLKPSNILVSNNGAVKVADFGVAITLQGELASEEHSWANIHGTVSYMSPEQILGWPLDGRSDLFSLGLLLVELASMAPLPRRLVYDTLDKGECSNNCVLPEAYLSVAEAAIPGLGAVLSKCLQFRPDARYPSAEALLADIDRLRETHGVFPRLRTWLQAAPPKSEDSDGQPGANDHATGPTAPLFAGLNNEPTLQLPSASNTEGTRNPRSNLGPTLDTFIGRGGELLELEQLFNAGTQLLTIKSTGGAGKTRLATQYARKALQDFPGGTWLIDLTEARTPDGITQVIAGVLEVPLSNQSFEGQLARIGSAIAARGKTLLILDNFEQIVEHAANTLGAWMNAAPEAHFLVTTREPTKLKGEHVFSLKPLPQLEGVRLFETRAAAAGAAIPSDKATRDIIQKIVDALDGIPLAIELAAARSNFLSPGQLLERLSERFKLLRGGRESTTKRQSTLQDLIHWSWDLLEPWEQTALAQLSVFRGGFFMESAETILDLSEWPDAPWPLDVVGALYEKSLLHRWEVQKQPRFGMYSSIHEYAAQHLNEAAHATRLRHTLHFAVLGTEDALLATRSLDGKRVKERIAIELENLLAGSEFKSEGGNEASAQCALAAAAGFRTQGPYSGGILCLQKALQRDLGDEMRNRLLHDFGRILQISSRLEEANDVYMQGLALARKTGNRQAESHVLNRLSFLYRETGRVVDAESAAKSGMKIARETGNKRLEGMFIYRFGRLHQDHGNIDEALHLYRESLDFARSMDDTVLTLICLSNMAAMLQRIGNTTESIQFYEQTLVTARKVGNLRNEGITLGNLGILYQESGDIQKALEHFKRSLKIAKSLGNKRSESINLGNIGDAFLLLGESAKAEQFLLHAISISQKDIPLVAAAYQSSLALLRAKNGSLKSAWDMFKKAEKTFPRLDGEEQTKMLCRKAQIAMISAKPAVARKALAQAEVIVAGTVFNPNSDTLVLLSETRKALGS